MLNLKQLSHSIDSARAALKVRKAGDTKKLLANNYQRSKSPSPQRDSILADQSRGKFSDPDSLFTAFDIEEQRRAVDNALQYAREVKQRNQEIIRNRPPDPIFAGTRIPFRLFRLFCHPGRLRKDLRSQFNAALPCQIGESI